MKLVGQTLRQRYIQQEPLLSPRLQNDQLWYQSTTGNRQASCCCSPVAVSRAVQLGSAFALAEGLFPGFGVPIHQTDEEYDTLLNVRCAVH